MAIIRNNQVVKEINSNSKEVLAVYIDGYQVFSKNEFANLFTLKSNSQPLIRLNNGVEEKDFSVINASVDLFLQNGTVNKITKWYNNAGTRHFISEVGSEPELKKHDDGSYSVFCPPGKRVRMNLESSERLKGNNIIVLCQAITDKGQMPLSYANKHLFLGGNTWHSSLALTTSGLFNSNVSIGTARSAVRLAILNKFALLNYRDVNISSLFGLGIGGCSSCASGNPDYFNFEGYIKEIGTFESSSTPRTEAIITKRHNLHF